MNSKQFTESTTSGSVASVSVPIGKMHSRIGKGVYPNEKKGNLFTGKKTKKKFANSVKESLVNEIDFASALGELQIPNKEIIKSSDQAGTIGSRNVFLYQNGKDSIYFFTDKSNIEALVYLYDGRLMAMKNYSNNKGLIYNLFQYIINIEKQKVKLLPIDKLTSDGITWIIGQLNRPAGFKITDLNNKPINADELYNEWKKAHENDKSGPTGIIIGESKNSRQIRENETRLMPMDIYGVTLTKLDTITENLINIDNLVKESNISEIGYASKLDDDSYSTDDILKIGKVIGNIENNDVLYAQDGDEKIYFLVVEGEVTAFVGFKNNFLKNIKNFTKSAGVVRALIGFLVHIKGEQLVVSADELPTPDGIKWLIHLINSPRGLNIIDQEGNLVDPIKLKKEWLKARETGLPGATSITISENIVFGKKLRENEIKRKEKSLLMSFNLYNTNEIKNMKKNVHNNKKVASIVKESNDQGVAEATGDAKFDKMLKGITSKKAVAKQQKADTKQQARDAFDGMFGGGNPADKLSIRKKGVSEDKNKQVKGSDPCWDGYEMTGMKKKGNKKVPNCVPAKKKTNEAKLDEEDIIIVPGQGKRLKPGLITKAKDRTDHEVEMALSDLFQSAKNAKHVYEMLKTVPETVGIEGWVQEKIIKANDYLNTVREYLEHKQMSQSMAEGYRVLPNIDREKYQEREGLEGPFRARNGKVYYYDPKAGMAYDPDTDFYIDYDELKMMDNEQEVYENPENSTKKPSVDRIIKDNIMTDQISKDREGNYIFRMGYYYRPSKIDPSDWAENISKKLRQLGIDNTVLQAEDIWKAFKGGAPLKSQSHYFAKIRVNNLEPVSEDWKRDFKRQEMEHELGHEDKLKRYTTQPTGMYFYNVPAGKESEAIRAGLKQTKSGKWYSKFNNQFGKGKYWEPKQAQESVEEGIVAKVGGALALIASLWGIGKYEAERVYSNSPQLQKLTQYHERATQEGDKAKLQEIERRIKMQKDRLSVGKGEVMDKDSNPVVPTYESSHEDELADLSKISDKKLNHLVSILGRQQDERSQSAAARGKAELEKRQSGVKKESSIMKGIQFESTNVTDYNPKSQGGTRKELLAKYAKTKDSKDATAARKAGATQQELKQATDK